MSIENLIALKGQPPPVDAPRAEAIAYEIYALRARATRLDGERDRNFLLDAADGQKYILKFIDPQADDVVVDGQSAALSHIAARDPQLPVPRIVTARDGEQVATALIGAAQPCRVRLMTYRPGMVIRQGELAPPALLRAVGRRVAQLDRALDGFVHPALAQPIVWDIRQATALLPMLPNVRSAAARRRLTEALDTLDPLLCRMRGVRSQAIHGDCHGRNVLIDEPRSDCVGIIDFGDMVEGPLALEVAVLLGESLVDGFASLESSPELIAGYTSVLPLGRDEIDLLHDMARVRIAIGVLIQVWREHHGCGQPHTADIEAASVDALDALAAADRAELDRRWLDAAGIPGNLLRRRRSALGANAELSYERPLHLVRGAGVWLFAADDSRLLDVYNNVPHVGHAHPVVVEAISRQWQRIASNTRYLDERIIEYVERLTATLPSDLDTCLFVNSGSEANDIAWRIAKSHTGHSGALVAHHAYHGITEAVTALSPAIVAEVPPYVEQLAVPVHGAAAAGIDALGAIERLAARGHSLAALLIDSALTSSGIFDPPADVFVPIASAVHDAGGLIIGDEVQYGLGRSGADFWGFARRGYHPDIVTLGKPVGNGYPMGVVITRRAILEKFQRDSGFFSTFGGNPVAAAAGLAVLEVLAAEKLPDNARTTGEYFMRQLRELALSNQRLREVRGAGLMIGVEVTDRALAKRIVNGMRDRGVLIGSEGPLGNVLKLRPPMPFQPEHVDLVIESLASTLASLAL